MSEKIGLSFEKIDKKEFTSEYVKKIVGALLSYTIICAILCAAFSYFGHFGTEGNYFLLFLFVVVMIMQIWSLFRNVYGLKHLFMSGVKTLGIVDDIVECSKYSGGKTKRYYKIPYTFTVDNGKAYTGVFYRRTYERIPEKGAQGEVLYDRKKPSNNFWIGDDWKEALGHGKTLM